MQRMKHHRQHHRSTFSQKIRVSQYIGHDQHLWFKHIVWNAFECTFCSCVQANTTNIVSSIQVSNYNSSIHMHRAVPWLQHSLTQSEGKIMIDLAWLYQPNTVNSFNSQTHAIVNNSNVPPVRSEQTTYRSMNSNADRSSPVHPSSVFFTTNR